MRTELILIFIVRTHHCPYTAFLHTRFKSRKINLVKGTLTDIDIDMVTVFFLIVQDKMLHARGHAVALHAFDIRYYHGRCQIRVLPHIFKVTSAHRRTVYIHTRAQNNILLTVTRLFAHHIAILKRKFRIESGGKASQCRHCCTRIVRPPGMCPVVPVKFHTHPMRAVAEPYFRYAQARTSRRAEFRLRMAHSNLLVERHPRQCVLHTRLYAGIVIEIDRYVGSRRRKCRKASGK